MYHVLLVGTGTGAVWSAIIDTGVPTIGLSYTKDPNSLALHVHTCIGSYCSTRYGYGLVNWTGFLLFLACS